ncbi:MAG: alkaline phosphatase family protein [Anaerolineae bacterium]|nr:alkaline phosphatase family protein [Anaerolineae bacterium]
MKSFTDLWALLEEVMEATQRERCFIAIYWGALDAVSHDTGARSRRTLAEARAQLSRLRDFVARWAGDGRTLFLALADHGHVDYEDAAKIRTADYPVLTDAMRMPPAGEAGAAYFFLRADLRAEAEQCFQEALRDRVMAMPARAALAAGLLGGAPHHPETAARVGELIAVCRAGVRFSDPLDRYDFRSGHGALSAAEMLVPIILRAL